MDNYCRYCSRLLSDADAQLCKICCAYKQVDAQEVLISPQDIREWEAATND